MRIGSKGDHRRLARLSLILLGADGARERVAVHFGHLQVGDHEGVALAAPLGERLGAAACGVGFQAQDLQLALQHGEVDRMVVDDQELGALRCMDRDGRALAVEDLLAVANRAKARLLGGERHRNARAQAFGARALDRAAHQLDQLARDGQAEAGAAVAAAGVGFALLERLEQAPLCLGAHADAGIVHAEAEFLARLNRLQHLHLQADRPGARELDRIADQVGENLAQARRVDEVRRPQRRIDAPREKQALAAGHVLEGGVHAVHQARHRAGLRVDLELADLDLREVQDIVDQREERAARFARRGQHVALVKAELAVREQLEHADDRVHRRTDLVAHGGDESALRLRPGARGIARLAQLLFGALALGDVAQVRGEQPLLARLHHGDRQLDRELLAARAHGGELDALADDLVLAGGEIAGKAGLVRLAQRPRDDEVRERAAERRLADYAESALRRRVPLRDAAALVHRDDAIERGAQDRVLARFLARQRLRALAHPQLELLVRLPQLLRAAGNGRGQARVVRRKEHRRGQDDEREPADGVGHPLLVEDRPGGEAHRIQIELRRRHRREVHAHHGRAHHERCPEVREHRALLGEVKRDPQRRGGGADGDQHRGDEKQRVVLDRREETHRGVSGVVHRGDADADQRTRQEELAVLARQPSQHDERRAARDYGEHPGKRGERQVVQHPDRQLERQRGDEMHRPDADAHREAAAHHPQLPVGRVRIAHARGEEQRDVRRSHRHQVRQEHEP